MGRGLAGFGGLVMCALWTPAQAQDCAADCVDATAIVLTVVPLGANGRVGSHAYVGPGSVLGANVVLAGRSRVEGVDNGPLSPVIGAGSVLGRRATVGVDTAIGAGSLLSRASSIGADVSVGTGLTLGYAAEIGSDSRWGMG